MVDACSKKQGVSEEQRPSKQLYRIVQGNELFAQGINHKLWKHTWAETIFELSLNGVWMAYIAYVSCTSTSPSHCQIPAYNSHHSRMHNHNHNFHEQVVSPF